MMQLRKLKSRIALMLSLVLFVTSFVWPGVIPAGHAASSDLLIIDNGDPGYTENPAWTSSSIKGYNGTSTRVTGGVGHTASWAPAAGTVQGHYKVSLYKVKRPTASDDPNVKIDIVHGGQTDTRHLDFTQGESGWVELGTFAFDGTGSEYVRMTKITTLGNTFIHADAVKFERIEASSDASLTALQITGGGILNPEFSPTVTSYTYAAGPQVSALSVTASVYDSASDFAY